MNNAAFVENVRSYCKKNGTSLTKLEAELGFSNGYIGKLASRPSTPPYDRIVSIANALSVPISTLTGETPAADKIENIPDVAAFDGFAGESSDEIKNQVDALYVYRTLTPEEIELIRNYRKASQKNKNIVLTLLEEEDDKK